MAGVIESINLWGRAILFGVLTSLYILKLLITKGPSKIFNWKKWVRPSYLDDPSFGTHGFLTLKDVRIHYVASGPEDKPLMLFVHGFPEFWYSWRYQIREFQKDYRKCNKSSSTFCIDPFGTDYHSSYSEVFSIQDTQHHLFHDQVVAIDQRGYSESSKPSGIHNYSVTKLMSDLEQVIQALGYQKCVLVGHDWGGVVVWAFGRYYSHMVDKLIVMNAPPFPVYKKVLSKNKQQARKSWYVFFFQLPFLPELMLKLQDFAIFDNLLPTKYNQEVSKDAGKAIEENIAPYKYTFSQPGALTPPINYYRNVMRYKSSDTVTDYDLKYTMPVLLIWGCNDKALDSVFPETIEKEASNIEVKRIPDANHFVQIDAAEEVNRIMKEWLNKD